MRRAGGRTRPYTVPSLLIALLSVAAWGIDARPHLPREYSSPEREIGTRPLPPQGPSFPARWNAGEQVSREAVEAVGLANCFTSERLDDSLLDRAYRGAHEGEGRPRKDDLRYLKVLHYTKEKEIQLGELICHERISGDLLEIFRALFDAGYPIEKMILVDRYGQDDERSMRDNNTSCFNFRLIPGTSRLSSHAQGLAVDINPRYNPYVRTVGGKRTCKPKGAAAYVDRSADFPYKIDRGDRCYKEFKKRGFTWGGDWKSLKDYHHFEKKK